ncbi:glucosamine-6-phosphate deaminase [Okibacterium endophyticum]
MIDVHVLPDAEAVGVAAADVIDAVASEPGGAVLGLATGSSPDRAYREIVRRHAGGANAYQQARVFILDEYVGLAPQHPERYAAVIRRAFTGPVGIPLDRVNAPNPDLPDLDEACAEYDRMVGDAGVDLQLLGVGANGHIAFNEPGTPLDARTHVTELAEQTRRDNSRFFGGDVERVPMRAITQGIGTILGARQLLLLATGRAKAEAVAEFLSTEPSVHLPVSALHTHDSVTVLLDRDAAARIDPDAALPSVRLHRSEAIRRV